MGQNNIERVKMVGIVLEIDGEEKVVGPEQCELIYKTLERMFRDEKVKATPHVSNPLPTTHMGVEEYQRRMGRARETLDIGASPLGTTLIGGAASAPTRAVGTGESVVKRDSFWDFLK